MKSIDDISFGKSARANVPNEISWILALGKTIQNHHFTHLILKIKIYRCTQKLFCVCVCDIFTPCTYTLRDGHMPVNKFK